MLINVTKTIETDGDKKNEKAVYNIDGKDYDFNFSNLNSLIDTLVKETSEIVVKCEDENYNNYKKLLDNIVEETKKPEFVGLINKLNSDMTNEQIIALLSPKTEGK